MSVVQRIGIIGLALSLLFPVLLQASLNDRLYDKVRQTFSVEPWASLDSFTLDIRSFSLKGLPDNARFELEPLKARRRGVNMQRVRFFHEDGSQLRSLTLSIKVRSWDQLPVAAEDLKPRDVLSRSNVRYELLESTHLGNADCPDAESLYGQGMVRHLHDGKALTQRMCRPIPDVQRGGRLQISLQQGGLEIQLQGRAEKDACIGDAFEVRLDGSGKRFPARLLSADTALLMGEGR